MSGFFSASNPAPVSRLFRLQCLTQCLRNASCTSVKLTPDGTCQLLTADPHNDLTGVDYYLVHP